MMRCVFLLCVSVFAVACSSTSPQSYASLDLSPPPQKVQAATTLASTKSVLVVSSPKANERLSTYAVMHGKGTPGGGVLILVAHKNSTHIGTEMRVKVDSKGEWRAEVDVRLTDKPSREEEHKNAYEYQVHVRDEASEQNASAIPVTFRRPSGCWN